MAQNSPISQPLKRRRQLLFVLPLLILPFVTLAFWAMGGGSSGGGGGKGDGSSNGNLDGQAQHAGVGINTEVPRAKVSLIPEDKMTVYAQADRQAKAREQALGLFSYPGSSVSKDSSMENSGLIYGQDNGQDDNKDPNTVKVEQKLSELQRVIDASSGSRPTGMYTGGSMNAASDGLQPGGLHRPESTEQLNRLNRLNELIAGAADAGADESSEPDRDMQQINVMLDKILAIQHPEKAAEKLNKLEKLEKLSGKDNGSIYNMQLPSEDVEVPFLQPVVNAKRRPVLRNDGRSEQGVDIVAGSEVGFNAGLDSIIALTGNHLEMDSGSLSGNGPVSMIGAFYDVEPEAVEKKEPRYTLQAVIAASQTLVSGAAVKMRLTADVVINGTLIAKGNFVYGTSTVNGERLKVSVSHIRFENQIFPVHLSVYDLDGMEGIRIPGAIGRDASKEGADRALQRVQMMSLDPSLAAQAAAAGIEAGKGLLSKKVKLIRVTVKAGYPVLLLDEQGLQRTVQ